MDLERIDVVLRPRRAWEAVDLGLAMLQRWRRAIWTSWIFTVVPVCVLTFVLTRRSAGATFLAIVALWWLRPMFERVPLFVLSRALFGSPPDLQQVLRELPKLWLRHPLLGLIVHRLHYARGLVAPVALLEDQRGSERRVRQSQLLREGAPAAMGSALACLVIELSLTAGLISLLYFFTPTELLPDFDSFFDDADSGLGWFGWVVRGAWIFSYSIAGPLHAAAGFALYINRRTQQEGWDIELAFRRLATRVARMTSGVGAAFLVLLASAWLVPARAQDAAPLPAASSAAKTPERVVARILADDPDFSTTARTRKLVWGKDEPETERPSRDVGWLVAVFAELVSVFLWVAAALVVVGLAVVIARSLGWIRWERKQVAPVVAPPTQLFGLDLRPESLPADIVGEARALWLHGEAVAALGLLYRAAISRLIEHDGLQLERSDTESDCLRRASALASVSRGELFAAITRAWLACAYSTHRPSDAAFDELCTAWPQQFDARVAA